MQGCKCVVSREGYVEAMQTTRGLKDGLFTLNKDKKKSTDGVLKGAQIKTPRQKTITDKNRKQKWKRPLERNQTTETQTWQPVATQYKESQGLFIQEGRGTQVRTKSKMTTRHRCWNQELAKKAGKWRQEVEHRKFMEIRQNKTRNRTVCDSAAFKPVQSGCQWLY